MENDTKDTFLSKLNNQIAIDKEVLSILPKNNKKNLGVYKEKCNEIKLIYDNFDLNIIHEMKRRINKINSFKKNPKIDELNEELQKYDKLILLNNNVTSFEKMQLNELLYIFRRFYKNNLELLIENINNCLNRFEDVGINLSIHDFCYSSYTREFMRLILSEHDIDGDLKESFENIYWKCPDIFLHIEQNFRYIYFKYEKEIDKYYSNVENEILKDLKVKSKEEAFKRYNLLSYNLQEYINSDDSIILEKFKDNTYNIKDFEPQGVEKIVNKLKNLESIDMDEFYSNIFKLQNNLFEYKNYLNYKFIYDSIVLIINDSNNYDSLYNQNFKNIKKLESKLFKINKKYDKRKRHFGLIFKLFNKNNNKLETGNDNINQIILDLKQEYKNLETNKMNSLIKKHLNTNSTIYEVFSLVSYFYDFIAESIIKEYPDIVQEDISLKIEEFRKFINHPDNTLINNTTLNQDKDIALIIKDKYNLFNIAVTKEDFEEENIDNLINNVNIICINNNIKKSSISFEDIKFYLHCKTIVDVE